MSRQEGKLNLLRRAWRWRRRKLNLLPGDASAILEYYYTSELNLLLGDASAILEYYYTNELNMRVSLSA